ncbi:iron-containing alcohol dehydrogenase [Rhodococcus sp. IEGM 1330]|uniref:iron-containing alcohol dehydrogenase n=1 Tax=Rhodococcus sp. IEGM 1330 TaxID=3082225 RepID=UPI002953BEE0|nr:iron-containing alcohol dehydrogenase [Rhodococcus sp. IEGM 1330]MDV8025325.1 iron-containing alcohol dehydrogenase [Rhodococcus sp. IEGM 1330]
MTTGITQPTAIGVLRLPERILFGDGSFASVSVEASRLGRNVLLVCDPFLLNSPELDAILRDLAALSVKVTVESGVIPELPLEHVQKLIDSHRHSVPDAVVAVGGGSAIDLGKLIALGLSHNGALNDWYGENAIPFPVLPVVAVPTTAGTGSEVTGVAVLTDPGRDLKVGISSPYLIPRVAIVDPLLAVGAPASVTAASGADALVHAVEAHTAAVRSSDWSAQLPVFVGQNLLSSPLAIEAIRLIVPNLPRAVRDGNDLDARRAMARGSLLAGMAFGSAGTHLSHAIQYPVGALTHTPHGLGTGLLLPFVLDAVLPTCIPQLEQIAEVLDVRESTAEASARAAIDTIARVFSEIGLPADLRSIGVDDKDVSRIVELSLTVKRLVSNSTHPPTSELIEGIVRAALDGDRARPVSYGTTDQNRIHA